MRPVSPNLPRLAYLTATYPAVSHTFILREVGELRTLGFTVDTFSMRKPGASLVTGPEEQAAFDDTYYLISEGKNPLEMLKSIGAAMANPKRFFQTLLLAFQTAPPGVKGGLKQLAYLAEAMILARQLQARGVDHLHNHFADLSANVAMLASSFTGIPFSYTLHGPAELYEPEKWQLRCKTERAAFVACISHFCRSQAMYFSDPSHWHKLKIVHCGVMPELYAHTTDTSSAGVNLLFVGRLTAIKGLRVLLDAFAIAKTKNDALTLTIVGDGDDRQALEELAAPFEGAVTFLGYQSQHGVADALAAADVLVLPSFAEGLPVVLMEAFAAGKPVITSQLAGVGDLVENNVSGFLTQAGDVDALADRIIALAASADMRAKMGAHGCQKVTIGFDARIEAARIGALFAGEAGDDLRPTPMKRPS